MKLQAAANHDETRSVRSVYAQHSTKTKTNEWIIPSMHAVPGCHRRMYRPPAQPVRSLIHRTRLKRGDSNQNHANDSRRHSSPQRTGTRREKQRRQRRPQKNYDSSTMSKPTHIAHQLRLILPTPHDTGSLQDDLLLTYQYYEK